MPLLKPSNKTTKEQIRINIEKELIEHMEAYCQWAGIKKIDEFIEQAAQFILKKDKDWQKVANDYLSTADKSSGV